MSQENVEFALTASRIEDALVKISRASGEPNLRVALVSAATLVQTAILGGQSAADLYQALDTLDGVEGSAYVDAVLNRSVDFHLLEDGSTLGFWLLPVAIDHPAVTSATIDLRVDSLQLLRASADLAHQLGMLGDSKGWVAAFPRLISGTALQQADLSALIRFPHSARKLMQGLVKGVDFKVDPSLTAEAGLYYLPLVTKHPVGADIHTPQPSAAVTARIEAWVAESLPVRSRVHAPKGPLPFSDAMAAGDQFLRQLTFDTIITAVVTDMGVAPGGLNIILAAYRTDSPAGSHEYLGCTVSSLLTGAVLSTVALPVPTQATPYLAEAKTFLLAQGVAAVQLMPEPIPAVVCHHCGELQFSLPARGTAQPAQSVVQH